MKPVPRALWLGVPERRLFAVLHLPAGAARAAVLVDAPWLHEHARSYRLFALLADALADLGIATLRFDYYGTGDSDGTDTDFTLGSAVTDTRSALAYLRSQTRGVPIALLGVRAGALVALATARCEAVDALWLWQPAVSAADHLSHLQNRDEALRAIRAPGEPKRQLHTLIGLPISQVLLAEMRNAPPVVVDDPALPPVFVLDAPDAASISRRAPTIALPGALHEWTNRMEMDQFPLASVREIAARLADAAGSS